MLKAYFEANAGAHMVAQFDSEETYMACFPALEQLSVLKGYILTESNGETMTEEQELNMELAHMRELLRYALNNIDSIEKRDYVKDTLERVSFKLGELCEQTEGESK